MVWEMLALSKVDKFTIENVSSSMEFFSILSVMRKNAMAQSTKDFFLPRDIFGVGFTWKTYWLQVSVLM
jgi:hypothetical protein